MERSTAWLRWLPPLVGMAVLLAGDWLFPGLAGR